MTGKMYIVISWFWIFLSINDTDGDGSIFYVQGIDTTNATSSLFLLYVLYVPEYPFNLLLCYQSIELVDPKITQ